MRHRIGPVRRKPNFINLIIFNIKIICKRLPDYKFFSIQHHNSAMVIAKTKFIFRTNHSLGFFTTDLRFLDLEGTTVLCMNLCSHNGHRYGLSCLYIGCTANDFQWRYASYINRSDAEFIGIGVLPARQHFSNHYTFQSAFYVFKFFNPFHLQANISKILRCFFGFQVCFNVLFKPVI